MRGTILGNKQTPHARRAGCGLDASQCHEPVDENHIGALLAQQATKRPPKPESRPRWSIGADTVNAARPHFATQGTVRGLRGHERDLNVVRHQFMCDGRGKPL